MSSRPNPFAGMGLERSMKNIADNREKVVYDTPNEIKKVSDAVTQNQHRLHGYQRTTREQQAAAAARQLPASVHNLAAEIVER